MSTLERAVAIAAEAHAGQADKAGAPYLLHTLRVMLQLETAEERMAGVLHDVVEDSPWTLDQLRAEGFSPQVLDAVDAVTRQEVESYEDFVLRAGRHPIGRRVKIADLRDNLDLSRIPHPTERDRARLDRYRRALELLAREEALGGVGGCRASTQTARSECHSRASGFQGRRSCLPSSVRARQARPPPAGRQAPRRRGARPSPRRS